MTIFNNTPESASCAGHDFKITSDKDGLNPITISVASISGDKLRIDSKVPSLQPYIFYVTLKSNTSLQEVTKKFSVTVKFYCLS